MRDREGDSLQNLPCNLTLEDFLSACGSSPIVNKKSGSEIRSAGCISDTRI